RACSLLSSFPTRRSSDLLEHLRCEARLLYAAAVLHLLELVERRQLGRRRGWRRGLQVVGDQQFGQHVHGLANALAVGAGGIHREDRKSTRLNSSHQIISY